MPNTNSPGHGLARLHDIFHDSTLTDGSLVMKVGGMQLQLAMLECDNLDTRLLLDDPLEALLIFSRDPTLQAKARIADGRKLTAVELQLELLERMYEFHGRGGFDRVVPRADEILALLADTLQRLRRRDFDSLTGRLDWLLKLRILERAMAARPALAWNSAEMKHLDHLYSSLDPGEGLFWIYKSAGVVEELVTPGQIERLVHEPPSDTRAYTRAHLLRAAGEERIRRVDWDVVTVKPDPAGYANRTVDLDDPAGFTKDQTEAIFQTARTLDDILDGLDGLANGRSSASAPSMSPPTQDERKPARPNDLTLA